MNIAIIRETFKKQFGASGAVYASPGRVNLIGEHTDYNMGFVLPGAIDKRMVLELKPNGADKCRVYSVDMNQNGEFVVGQPEPPVSLSLGKENAWILFFYGVIEEMRKRGKTIEGFDCVFGGDIPLGGGLSSSAALECAIGFALNETYKLGFDRYELARIGQLTEHNYLGVKCGIMDQFASLFGQAGQVIKLDCRSLTFEVVPFDPKGYRVVLINTMVKHALGTEYNERVAQCAAGVAAVKTKHPEVQSLRDVTEAMLNEVRGICEPLSFQRSMFVIQENNRLLTACEALKKGDYKTFGEKVYGSHEGLSKDYGVSCEELDFLVEQAVKYNALGARMMGGGFGGCTINFIEEGKYEDFIGNATTAYEKKYHITPLIYPVVISDGTAQIA